MKILHVTDWANGGLATYLETVCNSQLNKNEVFLLAAKDNSEERIIKRDGFIPLDHYSRSVKGMWYAMKTCRKEIQSLQPDILYIHSSFAGVFARLAVVNLPKKPKLLYCAHGWSFLMQGNRIKQQLYTWIEKILSHITDAIITISDNEHKAALEAGINKDKLYKIEHGISPIREEIDPTFLENATFLRGKLNILFLGRYDEQKGFDWLMEFITCHPTDNICWHTAGKSIIGQAALIPDNVINHGWVPHKKVSQLLMRCDAVIMPSRWEGFGLTVIEAMKYNKPILASTNGALPELVKENENGWLFNMKDDQDLLKILKVITPKNLTKAGSTGYKIFMEKYSEDKMIEKLNILIVSLLST